MCYHKKSILSLFCLLVLFISCKKRREEPAPTYKNIEGVVYTHQSDSNIIVNGAELRMDGVIKLTNENGYFLFEQVNFGTHDLVISHTDYLTKEITLNITSSSDHYHEILVYKKTTPSNFIAEDSLNFSSDVDSLFFSIVTTDNTIVWEISTSEDKPWVSTKQQQANGNEQIEVCVNRSFLTTDIDQAYVIVTNKITAEKDSVLVIVEKKPVVFDGLLAYFPFTYNTLDKSGNGFDGVNDGAILTSDRKGQSNTAYAFDGDDMISISEPNAFPSLSAFSISVWIYPQQQNTTSIGAVILSKESPQRDMIFSLSSLQPSYQYQTFSEGNTSHTLTTNVITLDHWYHLVFTRDEDKKEVFYINGNLLSEKTQSTSISWLGQNMGIGGFPLYHQYNDYSYHFQGKIDELRIYDRVISSVEIDSLYHD